jgi:hypothetical protein
VTDFHRRTNRRWLFDASPAHDVIAFVRDNFDDRPFDAPETARSYIDIFAAAARRSTKPHYLLTTRPGVMGRALVGILREHRVAAVGGFREGLMAIDRLARKPVWLGEHSRPTCRSSRREKVAVEWFETVLAAGQSRWKIPVTGGAGYWR